MKKKLVTGIVALSTTAILALSMTGCADKKISQSDFYDGVMTSYTAYNTNYEQAMAEPILQQDISLTAISYGETSVETTHYGVTYTNTCSCSGTLTVDVKVIDGVIHLFVDASFSGTGSYFNSNSGKEEKGAMEESTKWEFGVYNGTYYARRYTSYDVESSSYGTPVLGSPEVNKIYTTYSTKSAYYSALSSVLNQYNDGYIMNAFESIPSYYVPDVEYFKNGKTYKVTSSYSGIGTYDGFNIRTNAQSLSFGPKGPEAMTYITSEKSTVGNRQITKDARISYASNAQAIGDPAADGYTRNNYLSTSSAYVSPDALEDLMEATLPLNF